MNHTIYFDGDCNLCHWSVKLILKADKRDQFRFSSLRSEFAVANLKLSDDKQAIPDSIIYQAGKKQYLKSKAVLEIIKTLGGYWRILLIFRILPCKFLDRLYDIIARHRYSWFGKNNCLIPNNAMKSKFLE